MPGYAELHVLSNYSFLRGASWPEELVARAAELGYSALAITDECSVAGAVRAHVAAKDSGLKLIVGTELTLDDGLRVVLLAMDREGYGDISELISLGRRAAGKGEYRLGRADFLNVGLDRCLAIWLPGERLGGVAKEEAENHGAWLRSRFPGRCWMAVELFGRQGDGKRLRALQAMGRRLNLPLVAAGDVHMHRRGRRALQDVMTAIRIGSSLDQAGFDLFPNGERHLRPLGTLRGLYPRECLAATLEIASRCHFSLDELRYEYPDELVPKGVTPAEHLRALTEAGMRERFPRGETEKVRRLVEHELKLIAELNYEPYFLTVHDIVRFARSRNILCQGRGSAANSAVCYCLGITEVDPARMSLLFERFVSKERDEPPDIDVDFEHQRREEVIQYIYGKYGRHRAALAATVITYKPRSAIRDIGKALGLAPEQVDRLAKSIAWWDGKQVLPERLTEMGLDPQSPVLHRLMVLTGEIMGFPRHLSQHVGGFVIARGALARLVPIENASMEARTVIQWEKDDLEALGLLKIDILALGMLSAIRRMLDMISAWEGKKRRMQDIPAEDPVIYQRI
ncbi:MAG: PHP domain-containing protein, partial [Gammaproteobacteria bacterium]